MRSGGVAWPAGHRYGAYERSHRLQRPQPEPGSRDPAECAQLKRTTCLFPAPFSRSPLQPSPWPQAHARPRGARSAVELTDLCPSALPVVGSVSDAAAASLTEVWRRSVPVEVDARQRLSIASGVECQWLPYSAVVPCMTLRQRRRNITSSMTASFASANLQNFQNSALWARHA